VGGPFYGWMKNSRNNGKEMQRKCAQKAGLSARSNALWNAAGRVQFIHAHQGSGLFCPSAPAVAIDL